MNWNNFKKYFSGKPDDLVDIYFEDLTTESWRRLFNWLQDEKIQRLLDQNGVVWDHQMDLEEFLAERCSYLITHKTSQDRIYSLCINNLYYAEMCIEHSEIQSEGALGTN